MAQNARLGLYAGDRLEYRFCNPAWRRLRRPVPLAELVAGARTIDRVACRQLTFGDAPLDHPDFDALIDACRALGLSHFALETDGSPLARPGVIERLVERGFEKVFVVCGGVRRRVYETVMRDDAFVETMQGIRVAASSPLELYVVPPLLRSTVEDLEPLLEYVLAMGGRLSGFLPASPEVALVPRAFRRALLPQREQASVAARVFSLCQRNRVEYGFFSKRALSPCLTAGALDRFGTVFFDRLNYLKHDAAPGERFERLEACASCSLSESCPGLEADYVATFGAADARPVPLDVSMDWKLKRINRLEQRPFKNVSAFDNDVEHHGRSLLRINGHCNMSCAFCFVDRTVPDFATDELRRAIDELAAKNLDHLVLSGGEPTLHPDLGALVAYGKSLGFRTVEIQSNGVKASERAYAAHLAEAGLDKVTVSLHSVEPEHSDKITRLPGAFRKTLRAMHHFRELGVLTQVAHVITKSNFRELPATVRFLREEFPEREGHLSVCFGVAQPISDLVYTWVMPRFDEIRPFMREALDYCLAHEVGFGGMIGQGGYPPCMLDGELRYYEHNLVHVYRSPDHDAQFHKPARCRECSFDAWCLGVRKDYVATYGDDEIRPFRAVVPAPMPGAEADEPAHAAPSQQLVALGRGPSRVR